MANFFAFVFFGSIIGLIVGMFKPKAVIRWKEEASRKDVFKIYLSLVLVSLVAIGVFAPKIENKNNGTKEEVSTTTKEKQPTVDEDYEKDKQEVLRK